VRHFLEFTRMVVIQEGEAWFIPPKNFWEKVALDPTTVPTDLCCPDEHLVVFEVVRDDVGTEEGVIDRI